MTTPAAAPPVPLRAKTCLDAYEIVRPLSAGGFSIVYEARDASGQAVALKEYYPAKFALRDPGKTPLRVRPDCLAPFQQGMKCFVEEARILSQFHHPNIVQVFNFFRAHDTAYMAMTFERGQTLDERIATMKARGEVVAEDFLRQVFVRLLSALREVHVKRLLHLDIKPANIYLREDDEPVLIDFGGSRMGLGDLDPSLAPVHTPGYAAPEQQGLPEPIGPWTDIYSVGATLYACLAGETPRAAEKRLVQDDLQPAARRWHRKYSAQLLELIDWSMRLHTQERPQSAFALQKVLDGGLLDLIDPRWFDQADER